ncbi:MAG: TonB-dependent receptor plug domain-containing protein [Luteitalea sp.]|nr:TonB-dependent receptor plug domain-containing protein [Luteitalea sp.]
MLQPHKWFVFAVPLFLCAALMSPAAAQSQATTGVIEGVVSDAQGGRLEGATVVLLNAGTNFTRELTTDADGRFRGLLLPLGTYTLTVALDGFSTYVQEAVELAVGQTLNVPIVLQLASVREAIKVTGEPPLIETTRAEQATLINQQAVRSLPNNGRNFLAFMQLTPGVTIVQGPDGDEISVNGQKGINNNISVDGADFNNPFFGEQRGGQRPAFTFNQDAIREIVVVADGAAPEFGRSGGGFVQVVTKSGTNDVTGSAHLFAKLDEIASANSAGQEFPFDQQQFGATVGGPLQRDRLFYFLAYDEQRFRQTKQLDPARIEPRVVDLFAELGSPDENGPIERTNDARALLGKVDYQLNAANLLTTRYAYTWSRQENGTFDVDSWGRSANGLERDFSHAVSGALQSTLSGSMLNEFRFQFAREDRPRPYPGPTVAGQSRPFPDTAFDFARGYRFGMPFFIPVEYYDTRLQLTNNLSWILGRHTIKAGGELTRVSSVQTFLGFANGRYIFTSTDGFLNYVRFGPRYVECSDGSTSRDGSCPAGAAITGPLDTYLQQAGVGGLSVEDAGTQDIPQIEPSVFVQDTWQPTRTLTVQYGLRWEAQLQPDPITPPSEVFYAPFIGQPGFPSDGTIPSDTAMWQPRLGISWDVRGSGKEVVRANAGVFYARVPGLSVASSRSTNGSRGQTLFRSSALNQFGITPPTWPDLIPASEISNPDHPDVFVFDEDFQNPRTYSATIGYERELFTNLSAFVSFTHAKTVHVTRFINRNDPVLGSPWSTGLGADDSNGIAALTTVESSAKSKYDGLTVGMTKRFANGYQFQWNYTLSRDLSDDDNERDPFSFRYARADNLAAEYNYSDRDQRHRFNAWLLAVVAGVEINTRVSARSAQPQSVGDVPEDRIRADGSIIKRNTERKDNEFFTLDLRVTRPLRVARGIMLEPIFEVFNLTNSRNIRRPEVTNLVFNFDGTVQSGFGDPRQIQLGLRMTF